VRAAISSVAHWVPDKVLSNLDLEKMVDTTDDWIRTRTGIRERRILEQGATSDLGVGAARKALERRGIGADAIDVIIVATVTPDMMFPPTACLLQEKLGARNAWGFDLSAACSGFIYALVTGAQFIEAGRYRRVMVVGADKMSAITDYSDRNICVLFGDAGAAVILEPSEEEDFGILDHVLYADGSGEKYLHQKAGGSLAPATHETVERKEHYIYQDGRAVFKVAVQGMADCSAEIMERNNLTDADVDWLVPHQACVCRSTGSRASSGAVRRSCSLHLAPGTPGVPCSSVGPHPTPDVAFPPRQNPGSWIFRLTTSPYLAATARTASACPTKTNVRSVFG
jgi:3-oxoacyl-[acyl-carrier-protein] synthase-3